MNDSTQPQYQWIDQNEQIESALANLSDSAPIGIDTEFMRTDTFYAKLALIQIGQTGPALLVDPVVLGSHPALLSFLRGPGTKIVHSGSEDLETLAHSMGVRLRPLFDTQIAAAFAGLGYSLSYQKLVERVLGELIGKDETRSDWLARPLSENQLRYAAVDVLHLPAIHDALSEALLRRDRMAWALEDFARLADSGDAGEDSEPQLRFKQSYRLTGPQLVRLKRLLLWREREARRADRPRTWVLANDAIWQLCSLRSFAPNAVERCLADIPRLREPRKRVLMELVLPEPTDQELELPVAPEPLEGPERNTVKRLQDIVAAKAEALELPPELLCPRRPLEELVRSGEIPKELRGWRTEVLGTELLAAL